MLINIAEGEECRIAVVDEGILEELYMERASSGSLVGNIYKGRVTNVEPSIQAAFVDYGAPKHGFLHISDLLPQHFPPGQRGSEQVGKKRARVDRPPIQECLRRGQEVICQITKEGIGTKGPTLTTYLSIPGRFVVMMPSMTRHGVSRKIEDDQERQKLRKQLEEIKPPPDMGFIIRTAGMGRPKRDLQQDLNYLLRLWRSVNKRIKTAKAPAELYQESDLVIRTIRDVYSSEISQIVCDNEQTARKVAEFLQVIMPRGKNVVKYYHGRTPLFYRYGLECELEKINSRRVELEDGGSLVIDQTEAMVAIDVNSGRNRESDNAEGTAFKTNVAAAKEIARQLRLRDIGGVIVIDFIDMRSDNHQREVEQVLRDGIKRDRARSKILKISRFGMVELTRQRVRPSLKHSIYRECPFCRATGLVKSDESLALAIMRDLQLACTEASIASIVLSVSPSVAEYINNRRRTQLAQLESSTQKVITVRADASLAGDEVAFQCKDARGSDVVWHSSESKSNRTGQDLKSCMPPSGEDELTDVADLPPKQPPTQKIMAEETNAVDKAPQTPEPLPVAERPDVKENGNQVEPKKKPRHRGARKRRREKPADEHGEQMSQSESAENSPMEAAPTNLPQASSAPGDNADAAGSEAQALQVVASKPGRSRQRGRKHHRKKIAARAEEGGGGQPRQISSVVETAPAADKPASGDEARVVAATVKAEPAKKKFARKRRGNSPKKAANKYSQTEEADKRASGISEDNP